MKTPNFVVRLNESDRHDLKEAAEHLKRSEADTFRLMVREFARVLRQENDKIDNQATQA